MQYVKLVVQLIIIVGAINWGFIAYNGTDFVSKGAAVIGYPALDRYVKMVVGIAGVYGLYDLYTNQMKMKA